MNTIGQSIKHLSATNDPYVRNPLKRRNGRTERQLRTTTNKDLIQTI